MKKHDCSKILADCDERLKELGLFELTLQSGIETGCPGTPQAICEIFTLWSADPWYLRAKQATIRYRECKCDECEGCQDAPSLPPRFTLDCSQGDLTCDDVCAAFVEWACAYRLWACQFTAALRVCFPDGWNPKKVPGIEDCDNCKKTCKAMNKFHKGLAKWWRSIMVPLNDICDTGGSNRVPPPPEPPPFE